MKIAFSKPHAHTPRRNVRAGTQPQVVDHDLPVLAVEEKDPSRLDWEALMGDGVQPAFLIDGERRWHGRR